MTGKTSIPEERLLAFFDGELSAEKAKEVKAALADDPQARATLDEWMRQAQALATLYEPAGEEPIPERLQARLDAARAASPKRVPLARIAAMLALVALGAAGGWGGAVLTMGRGDAPPVNLAARALDAYATFAVEVVHPVEVPASQAAHLTQWVSKRLGHDIAPPDFAAFGYRLMGGRVLPDPAGAAALFMYENDLGHRVSLYVAPPTAGGETAFQFAERDGIHSFYWVDGALSYAVIGDLPRNDLRAIAVAAYDQLI